MAETSSSVLRRVEPLYAFTLEAVDGEVGKIQDLYFDDQSWVIRYLVIDTGPWIFGRKLLFSPHALDLPRWEEQVFPVALKKSEVKQSPEIDLEKPVSQQSLASLHDYYHWPNWLTWPRTAGMYPVITPSLEPPDHPAEVRSGPVREQNPDDPHLMSTKEVLGYHIHASDGEIGHVDDFFIGDTDWTIRYMLVDTKNWLPGRKVLVSPEWILRVAWNVKEVYVNLTREQIKNSPEYDPSLPVGRTYELAYHRNLGYDPYWMRNV